MGGAFNWLGTIFEFIISLFPHIVIVRKTCAGVKWVWGSKVVGLDPGVHIYYPLVTEVLIITTCKQVHPFESQALMTKDNHEIALSSVAVYRIKDVIEAVGDDNYDPEANLQEVAQSVVMELVLSHTLDELKTQLAEGPKSKLNLELTSRSREELKEFGVHVIRVKIKEICTCSVHKVLGFEKEALCSEE